LQQFGRFRSEAGISERFAERIYEKLIHLGETASLLLHRLLHQAG
jgi:hypothetical protein